MREVCITVASEAVEEVLDRVLPLAPLGVHERHHGDAVTLAMRGEFPPGATLAAATGSDLLELSERTVPGDWRERRRADWRPDLIGGRLVVRPDWAPAPTEDGLLEIVLAESTAFGAGTHPTTRACLELLLDLRPGGAFADLGCGSGVLAIAAARLGYATVTAIDRDRECLAATRASARLNGVSVEVRIADVATEPPPAAATLAANVPASVHVALAERLPAGSRRLIVGGMLADEVQAVASAYAARGLRELCRLGTGEWPTVLLGREERFGP